MKKQYTQKEIDTREHVYWKVPPLPVYRLMCAAEIAYRYYPEITKDIEKAMGQALTIVDDAMRSLEWNHSPVDFFIRFYEQMFKLADLQYQKDLQQKDLQQPNDDPLQAM